MLDHWSNRFRQLCAIPMGYGGFIANIFLTVVILKYSPESVKNYSTMIMVMTVSDLLNAFCSIMTSFRMVPRSTEMFIFFQGACEKIFDDKTTKSRFCMFWYAIQVESTLLNHIVMVFSYIYRVLVITMNMDAVNRKVVQLVTYGYSLCHMGYLTWIFFESWEPIEKYDEALSKIYPEIVNSGWTYSGILDLNVYPQIVFNALVITTPWFVFLAAGFSRWKIGKYLNNFQFSDNLKHQHKSLLNLLLYQTIGPFFYTITVILYILIGRTSTQASALLENLIPFPLFFMCAVSPIITLYLIAPYRLACIKVWERLFGAKWKTTSGVVEQSTGKSVAIVT